MFQVFLPFIILLRDFLVEVFRKSFLIVRTEPFARGYPGERGSGGAPGETPNELPAFNAILSVIPEAKLDPKAPGIFGEGAENKTRAACVPRHCADSLKKCPLLQLLIYLGEGVNRQFQVFAGMGGGDLRADTRGAVRNDWIKEADHVDAFL